MRNEPCWLPLDQILRINEIMVAETGEPAQVLNLGLLESAWAKPINRWNYEREDDLLTLAVTLMVGVAQNHAFAQGNKRTAFGACQLFLSLNGYGIDPALDGVDLADQLVAVLEHRMDSSDLAMTLRPWIRAL